MHLLWRDAMDFSLRQRQPPECADRVLFHFSGERGRFDEVFDVGKRPAVVLVIVVMVMMMVVVLVDGDVELGSRNSPSFAGLGGHFKLVELQSGQLAAEGLDVESEINQRAEEHVTTDATDAVEIE
jgi:hypothetical protein